MAEQLKVPKITKFEFLEAVRGGTRDAVWELVSGGNPAPTADFFRRGPKRYRSRNQSFGPRARSDDRSHSPGT
jgi:hypothetical protein